jgi:hypothetical protein
MLKLLGTFEQPIHPSIEQELSEKHDLFVNIGCGEGYYGIGVKLKSPDTKIIMADIDELCKSEVKINAFLNGVTDYTVLTSFPQADFEESLRESDNPWVFMDIEGAEVDLLDMNTVPSLSKATITVEMHDCFRMGATNEVISRFQETHKILNIVDNWKKAVPPVPILFSQEVNDLITYERRCTRMNWLHMTPIKG